MRRAVGFRALFLAPAVLLYGAFVAWPFVQTVYLSLFSWRGLSGNKKFVGVGNYQKLIDDPIYLTSLKNCFFVLIGGGFCIIAFGLLIAHAMQGSSLLARFTRSIYLVPHVLSLVAVATTWLFIFNPSFGIAGPIVKVFGFTPPENGWLGSTGSALPSVTVSFIWYALGFYVMLFGAGLKNLDGEVMEASELDGATGWRKFQRVTWPMFWSLKKIALAYVVINVFNTFALVMVMTGGGAPDRHTEMPLTYLYEVSMQQNNFSYGITVGMANLVFAMLASLIVFAIYRRNPEASR